MERRWTKLLAGSENTIKAGRAETSRSCAARCPRCAILGRPRPPLNSGSAVLPQCLRSQRLLVATAAEGRVGEDGRTAGGEEGRRKNVVLFQRPRGEEWTLGAMRAARLGRVEHGRQASCRGGQVTSALFACTICDHFHRHFT